MCLSVSGRPCCCNDSAPSRISPHSAIHSIVSYNGKNPSRLHCWTSCVCLCCRSRAVSINAIFKDACIIFEGNGWAFSGVSRRWKEAHTASPSLSMVPAATLYGRALSLLRRAPLRGNCCICIEVNMFKPTPLAGHQSLICKRMLWQERGIQLYIRKSQTIDRLPARHWGQGKEHRFSSWLPSFCPQWPLERKTLSLVLMASYLKLVGDIHGLPSDKHRDCIAGRKRSAGERH